MKRTLAQLYDKHIITYQTKGPTAVYGALCSALFDRLGFHGTPMDMMEQRIARWEALEEACVQGGPQMVEVMRALRAESAAAQALQPAINAELATAPAECCCGGPAGHVPNGVLCRKGMR